MVYSPSVVDLKAVVYPVSVALAVTAAGITAVILHDKVVIYSTSVADITAGSTGNITMGSATDITTGSTTNVTVVTAYMLAEISVDITSDITTKVMSITGDITALPIFYVLSTVIIFVRNVYPLSNSFTYHTANENFNLFFNKPFKCNEWLTIKPWVYILYGSKLICLSNLQIYNKL